jgi:molybdopterin-guanine dinucleotide biosynthesis protein A
MIKSVSAVILAGGKSTRMGRNKARLRIDGVQLIKRIKYQLSFIFSRIILSTASAHSFEDIGGTSVVDRYPETGPLGGITSVLESGESRVFCVACDMPFLNLDLIQYQCDFQDCDAVVPVWQGRPEVLHAVYDKNLLPEFQKSLNEMRFKISDSFSDAHIRYITEEEVRRFDPAGLSFKNINTPQDYARLKSGES